MAQPVAREIRVYSSPRTLSRAVAERLVVVAMETVQARGLCTIALSGGATPQILYEMLGNIFADEIPWRQVHFYWGDERYVSTRDRRSNFRMVHEAVLHDVSIPLENIHPMPTHRSDPDDAAADYEALLRTQFEGEWPRFDVVLLGIGLDGHTASLLPGSPALAERKRWVVAVRGDAEPPVRLTMTLPALSAGRHVYFLAAGAEKAPIIRRVLGDAEADATLPAAMVRPTSGELVWWIDRAAARDLSGPDIRRYEDERN